MVVKEGKKIQRVSSDRDTKETKIGLQSNYGKQFGQVSLNAYHAITGGYLDRYTPVDDDERKVLEEVKQYDKFGEGNIDLMNRPIYSNGDGTISTVASMRFREDGKEILIPTIARNENGLTVKLSEEDAIDRYHRTGEHLGKFDTEEQADAYADRLRENQKTLYAEAQKLEEYKNQPIFKRYGIDPTAFDKEAFIKWARGQGFAAKIIERPGHFNVASSIVDEILFFDRENRISEQASKDYSTLLELAANNERLKEAHTDMGALDAGVKGLEDGLSLGLANTINGWLTEINYKNSGLNMDYYTSPSQARAKTLDSHKLAYGAGNLAGSLISFTAAENLIAGGLSQIPKFVSLAPETQAAISLAATSGATTAVSSAIKQDWSKDDWYKQVGNVVLDATVASLGSYMGSKFSSAVTGAMIPKLKAAGLQPRTIKALANATGAFTFAGTATGASEMKNVMYCAANGIEYKPDIAGIATNMTVLALYAGLKSYAGDAFSTKKMTTRAATAGEEPLQYFTAEDLKSEDAVKARFRKLVKEYHSDIGGNDPIMAQIIVEYKRAKKILSADHASNLVKMQGKYDTKEGQEAVKNAVDFVNEFAQENVSGVNAPSNASTESATLVPNANAADGAAVSVQPAVTTVQAAPLQRSAAQQEVAQPLAVSADDVPVAVANTDETGGIAAPALSEVVPASSAATPAALQPKASDGALVASAPTAVHQGTTGLQIGGTVQKLDAMLANRSVPEGSRRSIVEAAKRTEQSLAGSSRGVGDVVAGVTRLTSSIIKTMQESIGASGDRWAMFDANFQAVSAPDSVIDESFIRSYANSYAQALQESHGGAYQRLAGNSTDVGGMLTEMVLSGRMPESAARMAAGDRVVLSAAASNLSHVIKGVAARVSAVHAQLYGSDLPINAQASAIAQGDFSVVVRGGQPAVQAGVPQMGRFVAVQADYDGTPLTNRAENGTIQPYEGGNAYAAQDEAAATYDGGGAQETGGNRTSDFAGIAREENRRIRSKSEVLGSESEESQSARRIALGLGIEPERLHTFDGTGEAFDGLTSTTAPFDMFVSQQSVFGMPFSASHEMFHHLNLKNKQLYTDTFDNLYQLIAESEPQAIEAYIAKFEEPEYQEYLRQHLNVVIEDMLANEFALMLLKEFGIEPKIPYETTLSTEAVDMFRYVARNFIEEGKAQIASDVTAVAANEESVLDELTIDEEGAILRYKSGGSYNFNETMRKGKALSELERATRDDLNAALEKMPRYEGTVYRNIGLITQQEFDDFISEHARGNIVTYSAFTSSSKSPDGYVVDYMPYQVHYEIQSRNGRDIEQIGAAEEQEVLFRTDSSFLVHSIVVNGNKIHLVVEEVLENGKQGFAPAASEGRNEPEIKSHAGTEERIGGYNGYRGQMGSVRGGGAAVDGVSNRESTGDRTGNQGLSSWEGGSGTGTQAGNGTYGAGELHLRLGGVDEPPTQTKNTKAQPPTDSDGGFVMPENEPQAQDGTAVVESNGIQQSDATDGSIKFFIHEQNSSMPASDSKSTSTELTTKLKNAIPEMATDEAVARLSGNEFNNTGSGKLSEKVLNFFRNIGGKVNRENFGTIILNKAGIGDSIAHGIGRAKAIAFASVPNVIKFGRQIDYQQNWKNRGYDTYVFAAPVNIGSKRTYVAAVVTKKQGDGRYYLHEVVNESGEMIKKDDIAYSSSGLKSQTDLPEKQTSSFDSTLSQKEADVNGYSAQNTPKHTDDIRFTMGGLNAKYANIDRLYKAVSMKRRGVPKEQIFWETGWYVGADGNWRFEIDDSKMQINWDVVEQKLAGWLEEGIKRYLKDDPTMKAEDAKRIILAHEQPSFNLGDLISHPDLFRHYPDLKNITVIIDSKSDENTRGIHIPALNLIFLNANNPTEWRHTLIHEIQHAVQEIERFAAGSSPESWKGSWQERYDLYRRTAGEIEARDVANRLDWSKEERRSQFPDIGDENTVFVERARRNQYGLRKGGNNDGGNNLLSEDSRRESDARAGEQIGRISEAERQNQGKTAAERERTAKELLAAGQVKKRIVGRVRVSVIAETAHNADMKAIVSENEKRGLTTHFFVGYGEYWQNKDVHIDGFIVGNKNVYLRYDGVFAPQQLNHHELIHFDYTTEAVQALKAEVMNSLSEQEKQAILELERYKAYMALYDGDKTKVWEEFIADMFAGMNAYSARFQEAVDAYWRNADTAADVYSPGTYTKSIDAGGRT